MWSSLLNQSFLPFIVFVSQIFPCTKLLRTSTLYDLAISINKSGLGLSLDNPLNLAISSVIVPSRGTHVDCHASSSSSVMYSSTVRTGWMNYFCRDHTLIGWSCLWLWFLVPSGPSSIQIIPFLCHPFLKSSLIQLNQKSRWLPVSTVNFSVEGREKKSALVYCIVERTDYTLLKPEGKILCLQVSAITLPGLREI